MLKNENSGYYGLIRDTMAYVDTERLFAFGMNLGYNGCTEGAQKIRANETKLGFHHLHTVVILFFGNRERDRGNTVFRVVGVTQYRTYHHWFQLLYLVFS